MPRGDVETYHHRDGKWRNRIQGEDDVLSGDYDTREAAVEAGRDEARRRKVEHIIKKVDGTIGQKNSYGSDPRDISG